MNIKRLKIVLFIIVSVICLQSQAQITNSESFDNTTFLPAGWTGVGNTNLWSRRTTGTFPTCTPHSGAGMVRFAARGVAAKTTQTISTPVIDLSNRGTSTPKVSFWIFRDNGSTAADSLCLYINTSASLTGAVNFGMVARYSKLKMPDTVATNGWYQYTFNVPAGFNTATNYILFKGVSEAGYNIHIDDITWESYPDLCTGKPNPGSISSPLTTICGGSGSTTLTLSGADAGKAGLSYTWKSSTNSSGPFTPFGGTGFTQNTGTITTTTYYECVVKCSFSGAADSTTIHIVKVSPNPNPVIAVTPSNPSYCAGSGKPVQLVVSSATAKEYFWSPANGLNRSDTAAVEASPNTNTTYTVSGTDSFGCVGSTNVTVTVRNSPIVNITSLDSNVCLGDSLRLTAQAGGGGPGNTYLWGPDGQTTASIFVKPTVNTTYNVIVKNTGGCETKKFKNVYVRPLAKAKFGYFTKGYKVSFIDSALVNGSYDWDFGDGNGSKKTSPVYTYSEDGIYVVRLIVNSPPCKADTAYKTLYIGSTGINYHTNFNNLKIGPNPTSGNITVSYKDGKGMVLTIISSNGQVVQKEIMNADVQTFDISKLNKGLYLIRINHKGMDGTYKLMVN